MPDATGHVPIPVPGSVAAAGQQSFLRQVFLWMFAGLAVTAVVAGWLSRDEVFVERIASSPGLWIGLIVAQLAVVVILGFAMSRISAGVAGFLFFLYAGLTGITFAVIISFYSPQAVGAAFGVTAGMFGAFAAWGYLTKRDLSTLGSIMFMALIGLILATVVNIFLANDVLFWVTTYAGVVIFCGLTMYDMQRLKLIQQGIDRGGVRLGETEQRRLVIFGALALYLDFINLFLFILTIFGGGRGE
jgi:hypothetical protein